MKDSDEFPKDLMEDLMKHMRDDMENDRLLRTQEKFHGAPGLRPGDHSVVTATPKDPDTIFQIGDVLMSDGTAKRSRTPKGIFDAMVKGQHSKPGFDPSSISEFDAQVEKLKHIFVQQGRDSRQQMIERIKGEQTIWQNKQPTPPLVNSCAPDAINLEEPEPDPVSDLSRKYRRRWVGGKYVDERIN